MRVVGQSENIRKNLHTLFNNNYNRVKNLSYKDFATYLIENNEELFQRESGEILYSLDEIEIKSLKESLNNLRLSSVFENLVKLNFDEGLIKKSFANSLSNIILKLKEENSKNYSNQQRQALFISYGDFPYSWCYMYGSGSFPILKTPEYFDYDYSNELFIPNQHLYFEDLWKPLLSFEEITDKLDLYNQLMNDSELFECIYNTYKYKYFILLNEILSENESLFKNFPIIKPFHIYGNQYDGEYINLHIIE